MTDETTVEQTASTPVPAETAAPAPADEVKAPELGTTDTPADTADPGATEAEKQRNKVTAKQRISELTRDKYQLRNENEELKKRLDEIEKRIQPAEPVKPKLADFDSDAEFEAAMDQYYQNKAIHDSRKAKQTETQEQETLRKQADQYKAAQKFVTDLNKEKENYEGIDEVMSDPAFALITKSMAPEIVTLIQSSDKNIALAYYLGTHLEDAERIASLHPVLAARELALLESRLETPKPKTVSNAPPPVKPVSGGSVKDKDIYDPKLPYSEYDALRKKQRAARRR